jgi:diguanylate cyclase (GGDEF)-like protein
LLLDSFERLEKQHMSTDLTRLDSALQSELKQLQIMAVDWAEWDDSYQYMQTFHEEYEQSNIVDSTFTGLDISSIVYLSIKGQVQKQFGYDIQNQHPHPFPASQLRIIEQYHHSFLKKRSGIMQLEGDAYLMASNQIIKSDGSGPALGLLSMLKKFDQSAIERLKKQTQLEITFQPVTLNQNMKLSELDKLPNAQHWLKHSGKDHVTGLSLINDINGKAIGYFKVTVDRSIYQQGLHTLKHFTYLLALAGIFFFAIVLWVLRQVLLRRLLNLSHNLIDIGNNSHSGKLVEVQGNDEITLVAKAINQMLGGLERFYLLQQHHQEHQRIQNELLINLAKEPCLINGDVSLAAQKMTEFILHGCQVNHASIWIINDAKDSYVCIDSLIKTTHTHRKGAQLTVEEVFTLTKELKVNGVLDIKNGNRFDGGQALMQIINPDKRPNSLYITAIHVQGALHGFVIAQSFQLDSQYRLNDETFLLSISEFLEQTLVVQERNRLEETLKQQVCYDNLTQLANRHYFYELFNEAIHSSSMPHHKMATLFIDLDDFKPVNDTYGHNVGDELLQMCAKRMNNALPDECMIARLGGDEFVVLINPLHQLQDSQAVAQRLLHALVDNFSIQGKTISISASIGISYFPQHSQDPDELITFADSAMYQAKQQGRNSFMVYSA